MKTSRKYAVAVAFLVILAVAFGVIGTVAPPLAEEVSPQQKSSSESVGHFQNPPTYDSGWVDIRDKGGEYFSIVHDVNTTEVFVDITGKQNLTGMGGEHRRNFGMAHRVLEWSKTYGGVAGGSIAYSVVQTDDGGYALAGCTFTDAGGNWDFWLIKADSTGNAQWSKTYGGDNSDEAFSLVQTSDGGFAVAGYTNSYGSIDVWLVKTDSLGNMQWNRTYGGADEEVAQSLVLSDDGGYALAGYVDSGAGNREFLLIKSDSSGNMLWNRTFGGLLDSETAFSLIQTSDGGYALAGRTDSSGLGLDFWLVKTNSAGTMLWNKTCGGTYDDEAYSVVQTSDGGYALAGYTFTDAGGSDFWLVKTDSTGTAQWNQTYGGADRDIAYSLVQTDDNGYALAGHTEDFGVGVYFWLVKTDSSGSEMWTEIYTSPFPDSASVAYSLVQTGDGGYALAGVTYLYEYAPEQPFFQYFWLVKTGSSGSELWNKSYGGTGGDVAYSLVQASDGGFAVAGSTGSFGVGTWDFWLVKTDSSGNMIWSKTYGTEVGDEVARSLIRTVDGGYALAGYTDPYGVGDWDFWLIKTDSAGTMLWNKTYGGTYEDQACSVVQTSDGGYALAGYTYSYGIGAPAYYNFWLVKTDSAGNALWNKTYGGPNYDCAYSLVQTADGGYAIAGETRSYGSGGDFWLVKTDSAGNALWNKTYGGSSYDIAYSLIQTVDGGYAMAGHLSTYGGYRSYLVRTDLSGNALWSQMYHTTGYMDDAVYSLVQTVDCGFALGGYDRLSGAERDFRLIKTDASGNMQWNKTYVAAGDGIAYCLVQTDDGGYALAGYIEGVDIQSDFMLVKTDALPVQSNIDVGLTWTGLTNTTITLLRGRIDPYWNYVRVRIWLIKEPSWIYGDINMDGVVDAKDLYILGRNYGQTFSLLSLGGIVAIAGIHTIKKRKQNKQPN